MQKTATIEEAWERKYPEQVVLVITKNAEGQSQSHGDRLTERRHRVCICSDEPPMFLIGIDDNAYTLELIRESKEFVIAYPSSAMAKETLYVGTTQGHNEDKATKSGFEIYACGKGPCTTSCRCRRQLRMSFHRRIPPRKLSADCR